MQHNNIVNLGQVREALAEWERVKSRVISGGISSFYIVLLDEDGNESAFLGGLFKKDPQAACKAALRLSAARTLLEDDPPQFASSSY